MAWLINKNKAILETLEFKSKYGSLVGEQETKGFIGRYWVIINQLRLLMTVVIIVFIRDHKEF